MFTIKDRITREYIIKKSRFICTILPVSSAEDAQMELQLIKKEHSNANHNCYSYIIGEQGQIAKSSDDGEPSKTAGVVIYQALQNKELTNILCVVTRYFGGVKLGAGGLIRAYGGTCRQTILEATTEELLITEQICASFDYTYLDILKNLLKDYTLLKETFSDKVGVTYLIPKDKYEEVKALFINITNNHVVFADSCDSEEK